MAAQVHLVIIMIGGSVNEEDHVKPTVAALAGEDALLWRSDQAGKPEATGVLARLTGLPGNPLSAYVSWHVFGTVLIRALNGEAAVASTRCHVVTATAFRRSRGAANSGPLCWPGSVRKAAKSPASRMPAIRGASGALPWRTG